MFSESQQRYLLEIARLTINKSVLGGQRILHEPETVDETLLQSQGNFVTLTIRQRLRGCIGSIEGQGTLAHSVAEHAWSAAFRDPRFSPVREDELAALHISISILTPKQVLDFDSEYDLLEQLRPGIDGLLIEKDHHRATFLPSVWESITAPEVFLQELKHKAGMQSTDVPNRAWVYSAISVSEPD